MSFRLVLSGILVLAVAASVPLYAQVTAGQRTPAQKRAEKAAKKRNVQSLGIIDNFAKQLGLSEEQKNKVQAVVLNYRNSVKQIMQGSAVKPEDKQKTADELRQKSDLEISAILTSEQSQKAQQEKLIDRLLSVGPAKPTLRELVEILKLTPEQQEQIKAIQLERANKQKEIAKNAGLTDEARRAQLRALSLETQQRIEAVFTPEQKTQYEELMKAYKARAGANSNRANRRAGTKQNKKSVETETTTPAAE